MSDSNLRDGSGNPITSTASALDVNIKSGAAGGSGSNAAAGTTGAAVPASADYTGFNSGGNLVGVSAANPLPTSLATLPALVAGTAVIGHVINDASTAVIGHVINDTGSTTAVTGNVTAVQPTGTNLHVVVDSAPSTPVTNAGTFATQSTLTAETTKVIGTVNVAAAQTIAVTQATAANLKVDLSGTAANATAIKTDGSAVTQPVSVAAAVTVAQATAASLNATVVQATPANLQTTATPIALTKGTQGATGFTVQELKDAGRNNCMFYTILPIVTTASEALLSLTGFKSDAAVATTTTPAVVTAAKKFRITNIAVTYVAVATAGSVRMSLRKKVGGTVVVTDPVLWSVTLGGPAAVAGVSQTVEFAVDMEINAGDGIGVSQLGLSTTQVAAAVGFGSITIYGYEY